MSYKVFTNEQSWALEFQHHATADASPKKIIKTYQQLQKGKMMGSIAFPFRSEETLAQAWQHVKEHFKLIQAAGGIVVNDSGKLLFIFRRGKWDLPKGKLEKGESIEEGALREVEEECNITASLKHKIGETWHTYRQGKKDILKKTYWFAMHCTDAEARKVKPQLEEEIEKVAWLSPEEVEKIIAPNTFQSIIAIYRQFV